MRTSFHINFNGDCREAFEFYRSKLGARIGTLLSFGQSPFSDTVPPAWQEKIVHANLELYGVEIAGGDVLPDQYDTPRGFCVILQVDDEESTSKLYDALAEEGVVQLPLQETFWSSCYGIVTDKFGVPWKLNCIA